MEPIMAVSTQIPESWKIPLFWATVDGSMAGNLTQAEPALLVGQYNATGAQAGTCTPNVPIAVGSVAIGNNLFGAGSMLARMVRAFFAVNVNQLLYAIAVPDNGSGQAATGPITIATAPTASGTLNIYIAGQLVQIAVGATDSVTTVASNLSTAINANIYLPVTSTPSVAVVTLTCKWKGLTGNDITVIPNYYGPPNGEFLPVGLTLTIGAPALTTGTTTPDCTAAISAIQAFQYFYVGLPYSDTGTEGAWATEFGFGATGRWSYSRQQYGMILNAYRDT